MIELGAWREVLLSRLDELGPEACLSALVRSSRRLCRAAWESAWWTRPVGLIEDPEATALDALAYARTLRELGLEGAADELVHAVLRAALGDVPGPEAAMVPA